MKLALVDEYDPAVVVGQAVVKIDDVVPEISDLMPRDRMPYIIENFDLLEPRLRPLESKSGVPLSSVRLCAPLPQPSKIICALGNYREGMEHTSPLDMFLKAPSAVIGPGETIVLPDADVKKVHHEAELGVVIGSQVHGKLNEDEAMAAVFGYTAFIDVSGRNFGAASFIGKSFDTFAPLGPWIVTRDEISDVQSLDVKLWVDGELRQNYNTSDMEHPVAELVAWCANVMTLTPGDLITCGTNHSGLGYLQDGEHVEMLIEGLGGSLVNDVRDPLGRKWPKGIDWEVVEVAKRWREGDRSQINV